VTDSLWAIMALLLFIDLLVHATRTSLEHVHQPALIELRESRPKVVERTFKLLESPSLAGALQWGDLILHFLLAGAAWLAWTALFPAVSPWIMALGGMLVIALVIFTLHCLVDTLVLRAPEKWVLRLTWIGSLVDWLAFPFTLLAAKLQPGRTQPDSPMGSVTDDELKTWAEAAQSKGSLEEGERKMIYSIFHLSDTLCREIMVPRIDVLALEAATPLAEAIREITSRGHSRVPVYEDNIDNISGVLYAKDILKTRLDCDQPGSIRTLLRPAYFVPEAKKVDELLREMQEKRVHLAVVVDEYGGVAGLVTLEDIVEEIVGEIRDEYDASEEKQYEQVGDHEYIFSGRVDVNDVNEILDTHLTREVADTLGGFIYGEIGRVPVEGETVEVEGWTLAVEQVLGRRIRRVRISPSRPEPKKEEENPDESGT
jgi:putative hemolysin